MLVDHERAWHLLTQFVASKPHHGSDKLLAEMGRILTLPDVVVHEGTPERMLRMYGVRAQIELHRNQDVAPDADGGSSAVGMVAAADHERPGGHDGHGVSTYEGSSGAAAAGGGADAGPARRRGRAAA